MYQENCGYNVVSDGNYFDITHSFKVGPSTYHVLGLRRDRPTYGNTYYIYNCGCDPSQSARYASVSLPFIHRPRDTGHQSFMSRRSRTATQKKSETDVIKIKEVLTDLMKSEHETLVVSLRKEINAENKTLLRSIEKEKDVFVQATTTVNKDKQEIFHRIEEQKSSLHATNEEQTKTIISHIELLRKTLTETLNAQNEQLRSLDQLQMTVSKTTEEIVEKTLIKHLQAYRSTSIDETTINQLKSTLIETFQTRSTMTNNDEVLERFVIEQRQYLSDLITKKQQSYTIDLTAVKQLQTTLLKTIEQYSTVTKKDDIETDLLKRLFSEQRTYMTDLITKQQQASSYDLIQQDSPEGKHATHTNMTHSSRPFKISVKTGECEDIFTELFVSGSKCSSELHTLCQRDPSDNHYVDCFVAPPMRDGPYEVIFYAKTKNETKYRAAICIQLSYLNLDQQVAFPELFPSFKKHQCILIEPFRRFLHQNEEVLIHMIIPSAHKITILNGDDSIVINKDEYQNNILEKKIQIQGNLTIYGQWNNQNGLAICAFEMN